MTEQVNDEGRGGKQVEVVVVEASKVAASAVVVIGSVMVGRRTLSCCRMYPKPHPDQNLAFGNF